MVEIQSPENLTGGSSVLITGGGGLVGRYLTSALLSEGYTVCHLSRHAGTYEKVRVFSWKPEKEIIDPEVFNCIDFIIHLAGANIGEKRWTRKRKEEIVESRSGSARLLHRIVTGNKIRLKAFITASATGYYGSVTSDRIFSEEDPPADDFLGNTCRLWEEGADLFAGSGIRTVKLRTAVILEKSDGALSRLIKPARLGLVIRMGDGKQYIPWIHIQDLCNIYLKALKDLKMHGAYNAVAPEHVNHNDFIRAMAGAINKPVFLPPVPAVVLRTVLGEMSDVVLKGSRISGEKIIKAGYSFRFSNLNAALKDVISG
jgi:uncharacterized protein